MSKEETVKKMNAFLARQGKSDAERKVEARLLNGAKQIEEAQKRLADLEKEKAQFEAAQLSLRNQMQAMWDLALEYQGEAEAVAEAVAPEAPPEQV